VLQLVLATIWLLDAVLQVQAFMFTRTFATQMIGPGAHGNPSVVAHSITSVARGIAAHAVATDAVFALVQFAIAFGIAWRSTLKPALAASIVWSLLVWWFGEGLGGVLADKADPVTGAPGAVLIYAILAVVLWPSDRGGAVTPFVAARAVGKRAAEAIWVALWGVLALFALLGASRSAQGLHTMVGTMAAGEPRWLSSLDGHTASLLSHRGLTVSIVLAVLLGAVAVGVYLPPGIARVTVALAVVLAVVFWVVGENFGAVFTNTATDVNSGPPLVLVCAAYYRRRTPSVTMGSA
jgi:hypothetical protein